MTDLVAAIRERLNRTPSNRPDSDLADALEAVLDRHRPEPHVTGATYCYEGCGGRYPCATVVDIAVELKVASWKELNGWPE